MTPAFHVITVHHQTDIWVDVQLAHLREHLPDSARVYGVLDGLPERCAAGFDWTGHIDGSHADRLDAVASQITASAPRDDLLVFIDGDAFPIAPVTATLLDGRPLAAIRRDENLGDPQPHPAFCLTTVGFWADLGGSWQKGPMWTDTRGSEVTDVGATLWAQLADAGCEWTPLLRTAGFGRHRLFFGVYADVVYHHGAGFRPAKARVDRSLEVRPRLPAWVPIAARAERSIRVRGRRRMMQRRFRRTAISSERLRRRIKSNPQVLTTLLRAAHPVSSTGISGRPT